MIMLSVAIVNETFQQININKSAGLGGLPGRTQSMRGPSVYTDIFNLSLIESVIPTCFKQTTIIPVPKEEKVT